MLEQISRKMVMSFLLLSGLTQAQIASGPGKSVRQALLDRGVKSDSTSLLNALSSPDEITQSLAANELAMQHNSAATERIRAAYKQTTSSVAKLNLAQAEYRLDPAEGATLLREVCRSHTDTYQRQIQAIEVLQDGQDHTCDDQLVLILKTSTASDDLVEGSGLLANVPDNVVSLRDRRSLQAMLLNNPDAGVRMAVGQSLFQAHDPESLRLLQKRAAIEKDKNVLAVLSKAQ